MTIKTNCQSLFSVFIDGEVVCQVHAENQILAVWKAKRTDEFVEAVEKLTNTTYVVTACRAMES